MNTDLRRSISRWQRTIDQGDGERVAQFVMLLRKQGRSSGALRVAVIGGGCSGLQYKMDWWMDRPIATSWWEAPNVRVVVDPKSALFVSGSLLDYSDDLQKGRLSKSRTRTRSRIVVRRKFRGMIDYFALLQPPSGHGQRSQLKEKYRQLSIDRHPDQQRDRLPTSFSSGIREH